MYIGRLQLKGFKSFGVSHELILSPGFTAIVGPNGSGKSNLLDALRWALGDSSSLRLRIERQSDLLFQGSESQPAAQEGEVNLQIRDDTRTCLIKRKVSAPDGATALFVDGDRKTLTELEKLKESWGFSGERFAFIGQGEISEVISQSASERRKRLDALFGIEMYRKRRMDASDRLEQVKAEHGQLRNLMAELNTRREEIAPEVARASKLKIVMDSIDDDRRLLYWLRRSGAETLLARLEDELSGSDTLRYALERWASLWKRGADAADAEIARTAEMRKQQTWELEQCRDRYNSAIKSGIASAASLMSASSRFGQARKERDETKARLETLTAERAKSEAEDKENKDALADSQKRLQKVEEKWKEYNKRLEEKKDEREAVNNQRGSLEAELQKVKAKLSYLGKDLLDIKNSKEDNIASDPREDMDIQIKAKTADRDRLLAEQEVLVKRHGELYASVQSLASEVQNARRTAVQARSKLNEVTDAMQAELYPRPVQYLLSAAKLNRLDAEPRAVIDVFSCDTSLSTALEAYLGGRQFQLLVEDLEEAGRCIDKLKVNSAGRATFLPLERCRPRFPDKSHRLPSKGIVGWAIDLVKVEEHWLQAIQQIMGDLLIVDSYAVGQQIVRSGFRSPVVTMDGDVFQPGGTVSGGRSKKTGRTLELKSQVQKLEQTAKEATDAAEKLNARFKKSEAEELKVSGEKEEYTRRIREYDGAIAVLMDQKETYAKEQKRLEGERGRIFESMKSEGKHWQEILAQLDEVDKKWDSLADEEDDQNLIEEREKIRAEVAVAAERVSSRFALIERMSNELRSTEQKVWSLDEEISSLDSKCVSERANLAHVGKECLSIHNRRAELVSEIDKQVSGYSRLEKKSEYMKNKQTKADERVSAEIAGTSSLQNKKDETQRTLDEMVNNWEEKYPYPGRDALPNDVNLEELRRKIRDSERRMKDFGDVNMGVLSEDKNYADRLAYLGTQLDDVQKSAVELERLIDEADKQAQKVFTDALGKVDVRFCEIFRQLFGGGDAHLEMADGDTIWDTGVDIIARPPGKHPLGIKQLSGGEKSLAAIAMLFATMETANCPLAVLDEVDAALDEVNLRRFAEITKNYAANRQILAMTHRRLTMEHADVLYGVTLSEPGLSQVVGVRVEDWAS